MFTLLFWKDAVERAVKTAAQTAVALLGTGLVGVLDVDWLQVLSVSAVAALVSLLTSVSSSPFAEDGTASLIKRGKYAAE